MRVERFEQLAHGYRLGQEGAGAGREQRVAVSGRVRAENDDGNVAGYVVGLELLEHLVAADVRKMNVEQDQVRAMLVGQLESEATEHRGDQANAWALLENALDQRDVCKRVV